MRKNLMWMLTAILFCGLTVTVLSSCSKDSDSSSTGGGGGGGADAAVGMNVSYSIQVGAITNEGYTIKVEYTDADGKSKSEVITDKFSKDVTIKGVPCSATLIITATPKDGLTGEKYDIEYIYKMTGVAVNSKGKEFGTLKPKSETVIQHGITKDKMKVFTKEATINCTSSGVTP